MAGEALSIATSSVAAHVLPPDARDCGSAAQRRGPTLYPENALERRHVTMRLVQQLVRIGILAFKLTQWRGNGHVHAAKFGTPFE